MTVVQLPAKGQGRGPAAVKSGIVAALDIGSTKISCLIAEAVPPRHRGEGEDRPGLKVLGMGLQAARGVRCGAVIDVDEAERAIRLAVDSAERMAQHTISEIYVNVSGGRPQSRLHSASVAVTSGQIGARDLENVLNAALAQVDPGRRSVLHLAPAQYQVDDVKGVKDPSGLYATSLGLDLGVVTVEPAHLQNLALAIDRSHLATAGFVIAPYAAAKAVLADDEMTLGVTVIDMGGSTTSFAVFSEGRLVHAEVLPIGGQHITNDVARGLTTTIAHAERMKTLWGSATPSQIDEREMIAVPLLGERGVDTVQKVPKSMLTGIIRPRIEEVFDLVRSRLESCGVAHLAGRRVVLTGGASQLTGVRDVAAHWLDRQVRVGLPLPCPGLPEQANNGGFAVAAGLLRYALQPDVHYALPKHKARQIENAQTGYMRRMGRWIAESF